MNQNVVLTPVLIALGLVEFVLRIVVFLVFCATILGLIAVVISLEDGGADVIQNFLTPWCWEHARELSQIDSEGLTKKQRNELAFIERKNHLLAEQNRIEREQIEWIDRRVEKGTTA